jgi:hypothetical protein
LNGREQIGSSSAREMRSYNSGRRDAIQGGSETSLLNSGSNHARTLRAHVDSEAALSSPGWD